MRISETVRTTLLTLTLVASAALLAAPTAYAEPLGNLLANPGFEEGFRKTEDLGTSGSSKVADGWYPWAIRGDESYNREPEFKVLRKSDITDGFYRIYAGEQCQQYYTTYATHTAGIYQRVAVTPGERVTFTIWVQIYTGQRDFRVNSSYPISDIHQPQTEATRAAGWGAGDYYASVGIDPLGNVPTGFGAAPPTSVVWGEAVRDKDTRALDSNGLEIDKWVQLTVSTVAQADHVTVYTKGAPVYRTKHNDTFWDEAALVVEAPATATPRPTSTPQPTATPTETITPTPTPTLTPTVTPTPTNTPTPTQTPTPTETPTPTVTVTPSLAPTIDLGQIALASSPTGAAGAASPTPRLAPLDEARSRQRVVQFALAGLIVLVALWVVTSRRRA